MQNAEPCKVSSAFLFDSTQACILVLGLDKVKSAILMDKEYDRVTDNDQERIDVLKIAVDELRRVHEHVSNSYDQLRAKALALIAGEVAIVTFLLAADEASKLNIPTDASGQLFLLAGVIFLTAAFALLVTSIASGDWYIPGDMDEIEQINNGTDNRYDSIEKFLNFLRKDYLDGTRECIKIINKRAFRVNWGLYLLLTGVIILIVIKYGGAA